MIKEDFASVIAVAILSYVGHGIPMLLSAYAFGRGETRQVVILLFGSFYSLVPIAILWLIVLVNLGGGKHEE